MAKSTRPLSPWRGERVDWEKAHSDGCLCTICTGVVKVTKEQGYTGPSVARRMEAERSSFCKRCDNFRSCVTDSYYCPPYYLASIFSSRGTATWKEREAAEEQMRSESESGFVMPDFCLACRYSRRSCAFGRKTEDEHDWMVHHACFAVRQLSWVPCPVSAQR